MNLNFRRPNDTISFLDTSSSSSIVFNKPPTTLNSNMRMKETRYHFGGTTRAAKINYSHRLPALEKQINHSLPNTMDLDEDLPINPVCHIDQSQR